MPPVVVLIKSCRGWLGLTYMLSLYCSICEIDGRRRNSSASARPGSKIAARMRMNQKGGSRHDNYVAPFQLYVFFEVFSIGNIIVMEREISVLCRPPASIS